MAGTTLRRASRRRCGPVLSLCFLPPHTPAPRSGFRAIAGGGAATSSAASPTVLETAPPAAVCLSSGPAGGVATPQHLIPTPAHAAGPPVGRFNFLEDARGLLGSAEQLEPAGEPTRTGTVHAADLMPGRTPVRTSPRRQQAPPAGALVPAAAPDAGLLALTAPVKRRTVDAVRELDGYSIAGLPDDFPSGPWRDVQHAQADINTWAQDRNTGDGAFAVGRSNHRVGNRKRGDQWGVHCTCGVGGRCTWALVLEDTTAGWVVANAKATHSEHPMPKTQVESLALAPLRFIPDLLVPTAKAASAAGQGVACISKLLKQLAAQHSLEVTWSDDNVRTLLDASRTSVVLDATMLVEALHMRDNESGLAFFVHTGADGSLERVFFTLHGGMETYALMESKAFIHYDTTVCLAELPINTCPSN